MKMPTAHKSPKTGACRCPPVSPKEASQQETAVGVAVDCWFEKQTFPKPPSPAAKATDNLSYQEKRYVIITIQTRQPLGLGSRWLRLRHGPQKGDPSLDSPTHWQPNLRQSLRGEDGKPVQQPAKPGQRTLVCDPLASMLSGALCHNQVFHM